MALRPPAPGWVRITSSDPPLSVDARLSDSRPNVDQGYGGWTEVARPRRAPLTTFTASPGLHLTLPILLDGWPANSVERLVAQLERMGAPSSADGEPPQLKVAATGGAVPHTERTWVIDTLSWGDGVMDPRTGNRVRQQVTVALLEYREDLYLQQKSAAVRRRTKAKQAKKGHGAKSKRVVATKSGRGRGSSAAAGPHLMQAASDPAWGTGEDLLSIAARELGDADRWPEIAELNGIRDPRSITPGQVIRLP